MLISVHVPKTAGTSLLSSLRNAYGERLLTHYSTFPTSKYRRHKAALLKWKFGCRLKAKTIVSRYSVIHGHFVADTFNFLSCPKRYCVFLREPVDRLISHYLFWKRDDMKFSKNSVRELLIRKKLTLNEFADLPEMTNFYSFFLGRMDIEQFDFVGLREDYTTSLCLFERIFGVKLEENRERVRNRERDRDVLSTPDMTELTVSQAKNRAIYERARRRFDLLCNQYLR
jgi:hypothetical protein